MICTSYKILKEKLLSGEITSVQVVQSYLDNIAKNSSLNAYVEVYVEEAIAAAEKLDRKLEQEPSSIGVLHGMVVSIKDVICYKNKGVTGGSRILEGFTSIYNATAVDRLLAAGAIIIGRTNCDEFAMGSGNEHSFYGPTRNAADPERVPGGSSGGAAVSVQIDSCMVALGSDTGGSVRQPAAFCGVIGLKPSYGRISRHGLMAYGSSFDQIGLISRNVEDIARVLEVISGSDDYDSTCSTRPVDAYLEPVDSRKYRIGIIKEGLTHPGLDPAIAQATHDKLQQYKSDGHIVEEINFSMIDYLVPTYYILTTAEASTNLSRYDGVRYGRRSDKPDDIHDLYRKSRGEGFGMEVKRRILLGTFVLSAGYYDAYYKKAQSVRRMIRDEVLKIYDNFDFIALPTSPLGPWKIGSMSSDPVEVYLSDIYTVLANLAGIPAVSIPLESSGLALQPGFQLMAAPFQEKSLIDFLTL